MNPFHRHRFRKAMSESVQIPNRELYVHVFSRDEDDDDLAFKTVLLLPIPGTGCISLLCTVQ